MVKTKAQQHKQILQNGINRRKKNYPCEPECKIETDNCEFGESELCHLVGGPAIDLLSSDERFKNIAGYDGMYLISNLKRVYSNHSDIFLKKSVFFDKKETITLCKNGGQKVYFVDELYREHFVNQDKKIFIEKPFAKNIVLADFSPIPGFDNKYRINRSGQVWSSHYNRLLKTYIANTREYITLVEKNNLWGSTSKRFFIEDLIERAFLVKDMGPSVAKEPKLIDFDDFAFSGETILSEEMYEYFTKDCVDKFKSSDFIGKSIKTVIEDFFVLIDTTDSNNVENIIKKGSSNLIMSKILIKALSQDNLISLSKEFSRDVIAAYSDLDGDPTFENLMNKMRYNKITQDEINFLNYEFKSKAHKYSYYQNKYNNIKDLPDSELLPSKEEAFNAYLESYQKAELLINSFRPIYNNYMNMGNSYILTFCFRSLCLDVMDYNFLFRVYSRIMEMFTE